MNTAQLYSCCQAAAGGLLSAIDCHDVRAIEDGLTQLRGFLASRQNGDGARADRLHEERLDALEGVADELHRSVSGLRRSARTELERMREAAPLLRHLTART